MPGYDWVSLTTDYGLSDGFVAACHGVLARRAPHVRVIDVTHLIPTGDVGRGSAVLAQTVVDLPVAVHVAVVDPGVGTARRGIAIETERGVLVGPDNGLLPAAADALGGPRRVIHLTNPDWRAETVTPTFHGRDIFAPAAARIAAGTALSDAGEELDPATLTRRPEPTVVARPGLIEASVVMVDHFGNVQLAAPGAALAGLADNLTVGGHESTHSDAVRGSTFADAARGRLVAYVDSAGRVALAINGGNASQTLNIAPGDVVRITDA